METSTPPLSNGKKGKNLTEEQHRAIFDILLKESKSGNVHYGSIKAVASLFSISTKIVSRIWQRGNATFVKGSIVDVSSQMPKRVGRKRVEINLS